MTMHLERAFISTTRYNSKGPKVANTAAKRKADTEHDTWLKKQGLHPDQLESRKKNFKKDKAAMPDYSSARKGQEMLSNNLAVKGGFKTGVMDNLHKESAAVREAILQKASRVAPLYNKGGLQYVSPGEDITQIGSKSRRP